METEKTVIEVNGVKMEVDLRHAKIIHQNVKVGTKVKILAKSTYDSAAVYPGVVVGFEPFKDLPTIIVAYLNHSYSTAELKFAYVNAKSSDKWDIVPSVDDELPIDRADVLAVFERQMQQKRNEIADLEGKRDFFLRHFNEFFADKHEAESAAL
jgi:hypothetical protein